MKNQSLYDNRVTVLNNLIATKKTYFGVVKILQEELTTILSANKSEAKHTFDQLIEFEQKILRPYIDGYIIHHGVDDFSAIKTLQSIKESVMYEKHRLKNYLFSRHVDVVVYSKNILRIVVKLKELEELFRENDSLSSRAFISEQAKRCIKHLPLDQKNIRNSKFEIITPQL